MGTNYYAVTGPCDCCGSAGSRVHIGKSSMGWRFSLHVIPELDLNNLEDWKRYLVGRKIVDEYGSRITRKSLLETITKRSGNVGKGPPPFKNILSRSETSRHRSWEEFAASTHATIDHKHGLLQHLPEYAVGFGDGPWDHIEGEFS